MRLYWVSTGGETSLPLTWRTQVLEAHLGWSNDGNGAINKRITVVEQVRTPSNKTIVDPSQTSFDFDTNGNVVLNIYHYGLGGGVSVNHRFRYMLL